MLMIPTTMPNSRNHSSMRYSKRLAYALCAKALDEEDDGYDGKRDGNDRQMGADAFESFDGCCNRDGGGDDSVSQ